MAIHIVGAGARTLGDVGDIVAVEGSEQSAAQTHAVSIVVGRASLEQAIQVSGIMPLDVILTNHDVAEPDLLVVADPAQISARAIEGPPLLVVEVLSPSTHDRDRSLKARRYAELGLRHYWIVDPAHHRIQCFRADASAYVLVAEAERDATLSHPDWPDLTVNLADLWR